VEEKGWPSIMKYAPGALNPTLTATVFCAQAPPQANNPSIANRFRLFETPTSSS
jgi:hypothetical protein